jgi:hypothetical protein
MKKYLLALLVAACGGSSPPAPATPPPADPVPMTEADPAQPADPAPPAEPPPPPEPDPAQIKAELLAAETAAFEQAKPVFDRHCARCHVKGAKQANKKKLDHFDMTSYPFGGEHAMELGKKIREVLGIGGGKVKMPPDKKGAVQGQELALIAAWADAFDASHEGGAHEGHGHGGHGGHKH